MYEFASFADVIAHSRPASLCGDYVAFRRLRALDIGEQRLTECRVKTGSKVEIWQASNAKMLRASGDTNLITTL